MPNLAAVCERALIEGYASVGSFVQYGSRPHFSRSTAVLYFGYPADMHVISAHYPLYISRFRLSGFVAVKVA